MWLNNYQWHFDYVRLAKDSGFSFEKTKCALDKNKICMIDVNKIINERDVGILEQFMCSIVQYSIESFEHAGIIDQNFLKLFRISQLAVEYLLFCKKYLDNTVTLLKDEMKTIQAENNELQAFNNELKQHTDTLLEKLNIRDTTHSYKCTKCPKAFSSEEYLNSHIERRHFDKLLPNAGVDIEMEIKEIKQKLNNTEKLIKNEELHPKLEDTLNKNNSKVSELLLKFESLKMQLESDFKILHNQKDFEEKYSNIFQSALDKLHNEANSSPSHRNEKRNSVTQTDFSVEKNEKTEQDPEGEKLQIIEEHIKNVSENITRTVDSSLKNVETQLQALWDKLQELETKKTETVTIKNEETEEKPPKPKTRQKLVKTVSIVNVEAKSNVGEDKPNKISSKTRYDDLDRIDTVEDIIFESQSIKATNSTMYGNEETETEEDKENSDSDHAEQVGDSKEIVKYEPTLVKKLPMVKFEKKSTKSLEKFSIPLRKDIDRILSKKFSELGLSIEWKGIPTQTYTKTMDILDHQVNLAQKSYPDYKIIEKKILKEIDKEMAKSYPRKQILHKMKSRRNEKASSKSLNMRKSQSAPQIEIKNRKLYETDSSSDENPIKIKRIPSNIVKRTQPYSAVIEELKQTQKSDENSPNIEVVKQIPQEVGQQFLVKSFLEKNENIDVQTKSVLKNFPSAAPIPKKRVLFNLKNEETNQKIIKDVGGGSSTSVASSVLDLSSDENFKEKIKKKLEDIEDLSDSDFSIL